MTVSVDTKRLSAWLFYCQKHANSHGEVAFDKTGMIAPKEVPNDRLPLDPASRWTYFEHARDHGLLDMYAGNSANFYRFALSARGKTFVAENHKRWWKVQLERLRDNVLTILVSVVSALLVSWALSLLGPGD